MKSNRLLPLLFTFLLSLTPIACAHENAAIEYSEAKHWLNVPVSTEKEVDVFYVYPTSWSKLDKNEPDICAIDNPTMLAGSKVSFDLQATAFKTVGNIYAPYYRQADAARILSLPLNERDKLVGGIPAADVISAFDYYIKHHNKGRPFILAGHSQGSCVMLVLLSKYMKENPDVYNRMIAAYVIGYSVTDDYLVKNPHLKFAEGPDDTGVIISYNTQAPMIEGNNPVLLPGAIAINPITWTREETPATAAQNLGSVVLAGNRIVSENASNYADARVDKARGVVICSTVDPETLPSDDPLFGKGVYHLYDYSFYYYNIRENAANRARHFLEKQ
jgi:pimeloyl-ACP methyl ester carboxylesterase